MKYSYLLVILFISACAVSPPEQVSIHDQQLRQQHKAQLARVQGWHIKGRMAVVNGADYWSINLDWQQFEDTYVIYLAGPFGSGNVKLVGSRNGVILTDGNNKAFFDKDPDALLYQQTGVAMPVTSMRYWVLGLSEPEDKINQNQIQQYDNQGRLENLDRQPWQINYKRYTEIQGITVPEKIFLTRGDDMSVRMVIANWELTKQQVAVSTDTPLQVTP